MTPKKTKSKTPKTPKTKKCPPGPEQFWKKFPTFQPNETTWEVEWWPDRRSKKPYRAGNVGLGTYRSMRDVEAAVKRVEAFRKRHRLPREEVRVYMVYTERQRVH